jgi:hypothetical protein
MTTYRCPRARIVSLCYIPLLNDVAFDDAPSSCPCPASQAAGEDIASTVCGNSWQMAGIWFIGAFCQGCHENKAIAGYFPLVRSNWIAPG